MGINTLTPRYLNLDNDSRIIAAQEMIDALNVRVSADEGGNQGVVKNIKGNTNLTGTGLGPQSILGVNTIIGCYEHEATNRFFVFVHNSFGVHSIHEMSQGAATFTRIIESTSIILTTTDTLHIDGMIVDGELHLYFTNGVDEPQKVNVDRANTLGLYPASQNESNVMKVAPFAPVAVISTDSTKKNNELYGKAFQFAMQWVYRDGEVSAIGEYSSPVVGLNTLENLSDSLSYKRTDNKISLTTPFGTLGLGLGTTIPFVRIFYKQPEDNTMYYIGEYEPADLTSGIDFYNNKSYSVVSDSEYNKTTDNVPKSAKAQVISANRLFYANYKEGFDKATVSATLTAVYEEEGINNELEVSLVRSEDRAVKDTNIGIDIDTSSVQTLVGSSSVPTTIEFMFSYLQIKEHTERAITFYQSDGTTVKKSFPASDNVTGTTDASTGFVTPPNTYTIRNKRFSSSVSVAAPTYADYNTNLAAALNGQTFSMDIESASAIYDNGINPTTWGRWTASFDEGSLLFAVAAVATSTGVDLSITPTSFSVSGTRAVLTDGFLITSYRNYVTSQSGTFGTTTEDRYGFAVLSEVNLSSVGSPNSQRRTFKSGESHSVGVVFEDLQGRTSGVYELGSVDIERQADRANKGSASVDVVLSASNLDSDFARYFYVYSGGNNIADFVQYSVPIAYALDATKVDDATSDTLYISLRALQGEKNSYCETNDIEYSYSEGDKLRIISYLENSNREYPSDLEFDVKGVETIEADNFVLNGVTYDEKIHNGQFLVVQANNFATGFAYNDVFAGTSDWESDTVVEIYSPLKERGVKIYHAIEGKYDVSGAFGVLGQTQNLTEGNAWYRKRALKFASSATSDEFNAQVINVESNQYFDKDDITKGQLGGKPYAVLPNEREHERVSSLTYSEPQAADAAQLFFSSFNASLANFQDYELSYGGIFGLVDMSDSITLLQSDKISRIPVGRNILSTGSGSGFVTQTSEVLGLQQHYPIEAGINEDREAFLKSNGTVYAVDIVRGKIVSLGAGGIKLLSDEGVSSWVEGRSDEMLAASSYSVKIGEDRRNGEVIFSLTDSSSTYEKSIVYSAGLGKFTSFVDYTSDLYGSLGNRFLQVRGDLLFEAETNALYSNFFGVQGEAYVQGVFAQSPTARKVFNSIGVDATQSPSATLSTIDQEVAIPTGAFALKEGVYYSNVPREEGTSQFVALGEVAAENDPSITFVNKVNRLPFRLGGDIYKLVGSTLTDLSATVGAVSSARVLQVNNAGAVTAGDVLAVKGDVVDGDPLRGAYAEVKVVFDTTSGVELFALSAHTSESGLHNNSQQ